MASVTAGDDVRTHHDLSVHEVLLLLQSDHLAGLEDEEVERRLDRYGLKDLPRVRSAGPLRRFLRQLHNPLIYVLIVAVEAFYLFSCRSLTRSVWRTGFFTNRWLLVGVTFQTLGQAALTYLPVMNTLFQTAPIGWQTWLRILLVAMGAAVVVALDKRRLRGRTLYPVTGRPFVETSGAQH